jgi:hypothetical protein
MLRLAGYYLVLERDALEFLAEVLDPIFGRLVLNRIRAACRAKHAVFWAVVDDGPDFDLWGISPASPIGIITTRLTPRKTPAAVALLIASRACAALGVSRRFPHIR